jgi:uroporphyrin-III C-methyltransferase/precorrin-2 dehydrogenase/sirohydrochlorin ferrochelatase
MQHFPIFLSVQNKPIIVSGGGAAAVAKLHLLMKTTAQITVFCPHPSDDIHNWAAEGLLKLERRALRASDITGARLFYGAHEQAEEDARTVALAKTEGTLINIVDNLADSDFITPAIVDRDPVTVAIGTEGAAPVLARAIKADLEATLPTNLGVLAQIGKAFRDQANALPYGQRRRDFWPEYYFNTGPLAFDATGSPGVHTALRNLLTRYLEKTPRAGHVAFVGAGHGHPDLLTLRARTLLDRADVILHDRLVPSEILELLRREATVINVGKAGFGASMEQVEITSLTCEHADKGAQVVRLKGGDPTVFGRLDEELDACDAAGITWSIVPGITAASAAVASIGKSLTKRQRNTSVRLFSGQDVSGFADQDWSLLARPNEIAALYISKASARFIQGRLLMHGACPATPVTLVENASRSNQRMLATKLADLADCLRKEAFTGPVLTLYGLRPRAAVSLLQQIPQRDLA